MRKLLFFAVALTGIVTIGAVTRPAYATVSFGTNQPGTATLSDLTATGTDVINTQATTQAFSFTFADSHFTQPLAGVFTSTVTGSLAATDPPGDSILLTSCAFITIPMSFDCSGGTFATVPTVTLPLTTTSASVSASIPVNGLTSPYGLDMFLVITLAPG